MRQCIECKNYKRGLLSLGVFPKESFGWCSDKCLFIWLEKHDVKVDGESIDELRSRDRQKNNKKK